MAERRRAHLIELRDSGRWQRHLGEAEIETQLQDLDLACVRFADAAGIAAPSADDNPPVVLPQQFLAELQRRLRA